MAMMAAVSSQSSSKPEISAAPISTQTIRLENWERNNESKEGGGASGSSLDPSCARRRSASAASRPTARSARSSVATVSTGTVTTPGERTFYRIKAGDTLETVAAKKNTTVDDLIQLNPNIDPNNLQPGQRIRIS